MAVLKTLWKYGFAILAVFILTGMAWLFKDQLSIQVIALLYLLPVVISARLWGLGPGILAAICAFLTLNYFFIPPLYTLSVHKTQDLLSLIIFLINAVVISQLLGQAQDSLLEAKQREGEATRLYELSTALTGLIDNHLIAQVLAEEIQETFCANRIDIVLKSAASGEGSSLTRPEQALTLVTGKPNLTLPMQTARGELGLIRLWRQDTPLSAQELRLLNIFANQGALAIERIGLTQAENRARVLEESDRLKSSLLSSVSHELRTPLATIKASISSLRSGAVEWNTDARQDLLTAIEEETDHLNQLVGNILDMSRIETGALNPQRRWNSLAEIVHEVLKRMGSSMHSHRIAIEIPSDLPLVPVDYLQLQQVFTNLLSNSAKYAPPGTLIQVKACIESQEMVLVEVSNEGPAVPEEHLEQIFEKFHRVTAADKVTGTGLGLSICKGIVEAHGGRIWAENAPGLFIFKFTLPMKWNGMLPRLPEET